MKESDKEKMKQLYLQGVPKTVIAKQLGCSPVTVLRNLRAMETEYVDPMIGQKFNKLTVLSRAEKRPELASRCIRYKCQCECGNIIEVDGNALKTGHTQSCGCLRKESTPFADITGKRFGRLTALYIVGSRNRRKLWHCRCDCGREIDVESSYLIDGSRISCGCVKSMPEVFIKDFLTKNNIPFIKEFSFSDLRGKRNPLRFDFALFKEDKLLCLIEYQGQQHTDKNNPWHTEQLEDSDFRKKEYCKDKNISLFYLDKNSNIEEELERICLQYGYKLSRDY